MRQLSRELGQLAPFDTRNWLEKRYIINAFQRPFSGYLGGIHKPGYWVSRLSDEWQSTFRCNFAIPCNSATSGLLAACMAVGIGPGDTVWTSVYTMSATAACAKVLGATVRFLDIEHDFFSINNFNFFTIERPGAPKAIIVTNLFGHPAKLKEIKEWCDTRKIILIEDNAQAPFAKEDNQYTGTIGHIGVFSLNIHKHIQTGEGGVVVTNNSTYAWGIKDAINHGELREGGIIGLNLRMTEPIAALAVAQLNKGPGIISDRRELAHEMTDMVKDYPAIIAPKEKEGCQHVYYIWAARLKGIDRNRMVNLSNNLGLPLSKGYSPLLSQVFSYSKSFYNSHFPIAQKMEDKELITFDICSYSPTKRQRKIMREIFAIVMESFDETNG